MKIKGIDISRAQEKFNFEAAKASGVEFIIIRAGIGTDKDTYFDRNVSECKRLKIPYGFYWYFKALDGQSFEKELNACVSVVKNEKPSYPVFFDMEEQSQITALTTQQRTDMAVTFCNTIKELGLLYGIYANPSWMENYFDKGRLLGKYDIWLANWTYNPDIPSKYDYNQVMWQWGIEKIDGKDVDANLCYKEYKIVEQEEEKKDNSKVPNIVFPFGVGDTVMVKEGSTDYNGGALADWVYEARFEVMEISGDRVVIGIDGAVTAAVAAINLYIPKSTPPVKTSKIKVGDKVTVQEGATDIYGNKLAAWVYDYTFDVLAVNNNNITIGINNEITAVIEKTKISLANTKGNDKKQTNTNAVIKKGAIVKIKVNSKDYNGSSLASWVYNAQFEVMEIKNDRVVIGIDGAVTAAMNVKDLIVK